MSRTNASGTSSFNYDTTGQLLSVIKPSGQVISYDLDAANKRAVKRVNGVVQRKWLYAGGLLPVAELDANDNLVAAFNGGYIVKNGTTYRLLRDHLGSVRLVVDASTGAVAQRLSYGPWGEVLEDTNPGFQPFGYAGGLYDYDTGLVRFGARDYDPVAARWTSKDAFGRISGRNLYAYALNSPIMYVDLDGLKPTLTLHASTDHSWISINYDNGATKTVGLFPHGLVYGDENLPEAGVPETQYSAELTDEQLRNLEKFIEEKRYWSSSYNCVDWALEAWKTAGQRLPGRHTENPWLWRLHLFTPGDSRWLSLVPRLGLWDIPADLYNAIETQKREDSGGLFPYNTRPYAPPR